MHINDTHIRNKDDINDANRSFGDLKITERSVIDVSLSSEFRILDGLTDYPNAGMSHSISLIILRLSLIKGLRTEYIRKKGIGANFICELIISRKQHARSAMDLLLGKILVVDG